MQKLADLLQIYDSTLEKERIGNNFDGGYVIPKFDDKLNFLIFTYGVADDYSFEIKFQKKYPNSCIYLFDHTIDKLKTKNKNLIFVKEGLGSKNSKYLKTLDFHLSKFDSTRYDIRILKIDIESNEFEFLEQVSQDTLEKFDLIIIEFHFFSLNYNEKHSPYFTDIYKNFYNKTNLKTKIKILNCLKKINKNYFLIHAHINNSLGYENFCGEEFPVLLECTYLKNTLSKFNVTQDSYPILNLDYPNKIDRQDYTIKWLVK